MEKTQIDINGIKWVGIAKEDGIISLLMEMENGQQLYFDFLNNSKIKISDCSGKSKEFGLTDFDGILK